MNGPPGHRVGVHARGFPQSIASITITPKDSVAPFTSEIEINVKDEAPPGLYYFDLQITDQTNGMILGIEPLGILILPWNLPRSTARHYRMLRRMYKETGAQGVLWYLVAKVYKDGANFTELKKAYELVRGGAVRKATIANILKRMIKKGLIKKCDNGRYYPLVSKPEVAFSRIDRSRVRIRKPGRATKRGREKQGTSRLENKPREPYVARIAFRRARKIAEKHGGLVAAYFLVYSLVGVRETGFLLLWLNAMFVYCEQKTGFCHYFYSELLHRYFQLLGLREGIMYRHNREHMEAMKTASRYVKRYYGSHQSSRRLHYEIKKRGYLEYGNKVYNLEIIYYEDGDLGVRLWDNNMQEILYKENTTDKPIAKREIKPAYPYEHLYEPNEETYFYKPGGIY